MHTPVTIEELDAALNVAAVERVKLPTLDADIDLDELLEIAAETDERSPLATIKALLEELRVRHQGDDATLAALAAVEHYHLPMLLDDTRP
jgi:hypothetical protein